MAFWRFAFSHPSAFGAWTLVHLLDVAVLEPALIVVLLLGARGLAERLYGRLLLDGLGEERPLFAAALGLGTLPLLIAAAGTFGWGRPQTAVFWAALAGLAATAPRLPRPRVRALSSPETLAAIVVGLAAVSAWVQAAAPPTSWDALSYHLEDPKRWLRLGRFAFVPSAYIGRAPLEPQTLYIPLLGLGLDTLPQMLHLAFACLCLAAVYRLGRRRPGAAGALAAAALASQPLFWLFAGSANTDFAVTFYAVLAVWALDLWNERGERRLLALSGALAGLACGAKVIGLWAALALAAVLVATLALSRRGKAAALDLAAWAAAGLAAGGPWYALNWSWLGDPIWPYYARFFGAGEPAQELFWRVKASVTEGVSPTLGHLLALPYLLIARGEVFTHGPELLAAPLLLAAAWALARRRGLGVSGTAAAFCALYALLWFAVYQEWRYMAPVLPWGCLAVGSALADAWSAGRLPRAAAAAVVVALSGFCLARQTLSNELFALSAARPSNGQTSRDRYLSLSLDQYDLFSWCNAHLPPGAKVMLFGDTRPYYLDRDNFLGDPLNDFRVGYASLKTAAELEARLRALGVTHVIVRRERSPYKGDQAYYRHAYELMDGLLGRQAPPLASANGLTLYALETPAVPSGARR